MTDEGADDDRATEPSGDTPGPDSFVEGVRDAHLRPDDGETGGERPRPGGREGARDGAIDRRSSGSSDRGRSGGPRGASRPRARSRTRTREAYSRHLAPTLDEACPTTPAIRESTALGTLSSLGPAVEGRYGTSRRIRHTTTDEAARRVAVRAHRLPDAEREGFADALADQLQRWVAVSDVDGVVPVVECGGDERPWTVTERAGPTLCGRDRPSVARALRQATELARALATVHDRGVVHAAIDPGNVVLSPRPDGPPAPALHNVGLADVYRRYEDPANVLDPRYAAPEYFESDRGIVDRATDVYGLGVVCFRLLTGVAPVAGSAETIAERVTDDEPLPRPSRVEPRLPERVDEVVLRATATEKFDRFETAGEVYEALAAVIQDG